MCDAITPFLLWFGTAFINDFSYCEALENAAAPMKHSVTVRNGASGTAPATPGLLNTGVYSLYEKPLKNCSMISSS